MRQKFIILLFLFFVGIGIQTLQGQSLILKTKNGTEKTKQLSTLKTISFSNNNLLLRCISEPAETYNLATISKLYFKFAPTGTEIVALNRDNQILSINPNPVNNVIYLQNLPEGISTIFIYRIDGVLVLKSQVSKENKGIQVEHLKKGLYLLKVNNQTIKFIKL
jgi:hypothetical protein